MSALTIPDAGLQLESSPRSRDVLPMQAFGITLNDNVIEDMIKCFQKGQEIELTLGSNPSFHYGSKELDVSAPPESLNYDLYLTNLDDATPKTERLPNPTMSILKKPPNFSAQSKRADKISKAGKQVSRASSSGAESDGDSFGRADTQRNGNMYDVADLTSEPELTRDRTKIANGIPKRGGKGKLPAGKSAMSTVLSSSTTRSLPTSPALNGVSSPNPAFSASQQVLEKNKSQRLVLVHELAARDRTLEYLKDAWMGPEEEFQSTLEKVSIYEAPTKKYSLKKIFWKELDVWNYDYDSPEDRQAAIDNAIKQYDKQRTVTSDPAWERLLAPDDRGKGIILSKLQATLAKGNINPAPRISVQKPEEGSKSDADSKAKGEAMSRSNSQPTSNKPKKISEREAQTKRLLSSNPKKPAPKKPTSKVKAAEEKGKRVLSEEFVYDSDSSADEAPLSQSTSAAPKPKPVERPVEKATEKPKPTPAPSPTPVAKPKAKPVVRAPRASAKAAATTNSSQKRTREDDDSSSSSGAPLSKRIKPKELPRPVSDARASKHRASDASQNSRATGTTGAGSSSFSIKSKNTSPAKSSPLASSPPTNASDLDDQPPPPPSQNQRPQTQSHQHPQPRNSERERERERDRGHTNGITNGISTSVSTTSSSSVSSTVVVNPNKKRKDREFPATDSQVSSRQQTSTPASNGNGISNKKPRVSKEVLIQARKFTRYYEKYESLHYEIAALKEPPEDKLADLLEMRERLVNMKSEISRAVASGA